MSYEAWGDDDARKFERASSTWAAAWKAAKPQGK
jgi:hypothetical protein